MLKVAKYVATQLGQISKFYLDYHLTAIQSALHGDWTLASFGLMAVWSGLCSLLALFYALAHVSPLHSKPLLPACARMHLTISITSHDS